MAQKVITQSQIKQSSPLAPVTHTSSSTTHQRVPPSRSTHKGDKIPTHQSTLLSDLKDMINKDSQKLPIIIPTPLTIVTAEIVSEIEDKTTNMTEVVDQYDIDEDNSHLLHQHREDPSFRILYKEVIRMVYRRKYEILKRRGLAPTAIREQCRSAMGHKRRKRIKNQKLRLKKKEAKKQQNSLVISV